MALKFKAKEVIEYPPTPEGTYTAICYAVVDIGLQYDEKFKKTQEKVVFIWELLDDDIRIEIDGELKRRVASKAYTISSSPKSNMCKELKPWLGLDLTPGADVDLTKALGAGCMLSIVNETNEEGKVFSNIASLVPLPKGMNLGKPENELLCYDMDTGTDKQKAMLPEWLRKKIDNSKTNVDTIANSVTVNVDPNAGSVEASDSPSNMSTTDSKSTAISTTTQDIAPITNNTQTDLDDLP